MSKRMLGKFLVYTNLMLSLFFMTLTFALYSQRLDWAPRKNIISGEVTQETGKLYFLQDEIKRLVELRDLAEIRWQKDAADVPRWEDMRFAARDWYKEQVGLAQHGLDKDGKEVAQPVRKLVADPKNSLGLYIQNPPQPALLSRGEPLKSIAGYEKDHREIKNKIDEIQKEIDKLTREVKELTDKIVGVPGISTGFRQDLDAVLKQNKLWDDEMAELRPLVFNQLFNVEIQKRRVAALEARMKELEAVLGRAN